VISKLESFNRSKYVGKIFYIEDYISVASIADARRLTDEIFKHNEDFISKYDYEGLKIIFPYSWLLLVLLLLIIIYYLNKMQLI